MSAPPKELEAMQLVAPSSVRQSYAAVCEDAVNVLIKRELYMAVVCKSMSDFFGMGDETRKSYSRYFLQLLHGAEGQAEKLMQLQSLRGAQCQVQKTPKFETKSWESALEAMEFVLIVQKNINKDLLHLHKMATKLKDGHLRGYLQKHFLLPLAQSIKLLVGYIYKLRKIKAPEAVLATYLFSDMTVLDEGGKKD